MNTTRDMAKEVTDWAKTNENVRAVVLTSSRTNPRAPVDALSDYDIELYVTDLQPFLRGNEWLETFGEILICEPPRPELSEWKEGNAGSMVIFRDAPRIDFGVMLIETLENYSRDIGYKILLDKDGLTASAIPPTHTEFDTKPPAASEYEQCVNTFWWDITYVAKCLARDEFFFAKYMLDVSLHHDFLKPVIAWYIGSKNAWETNTGVHGRWFGNHLEPELWREIEATFAGADREENWQAMFRIGELFGRLASQVGAELGYIYPHELQRDVTAYLQEIREIGDSL